MYVVQDKERVVSALQDAKGNITRAAMALGVSKQYLVEVVKRLDLTSLAAALRLASGAPRTGRPPSTDPRRDVF